MTTTYTFDQLKEDVRKEAEALRVHATKEELEMIEFNSLKSDDSTACIYGLMTGDCYSGRAAHLIDKCAITHFEGLPEDTEDLSDYLADKPEDFLDTRVDPWSPSTYSSIESYICLPEAKAANLIAFLRGETDNLEL
jgi:hypothetical protein